ncbi:hypothetical protein T439DRAFT_127273 [Meredithblackwellia eburnea MCA 4105]
MLGRTILNTARPQLWSRPASSSLRSLHQSSPIRSQDKVPIALISKVRARRPGTPLNLAKSALQASKNDLEAALKWIADQAAESGAAKAKKLEGRTANEGLVGVAILADGMGGVGVRAAMVEVSCETDFVARTDEFRDLLESITRALAFFSEGSSSASPSSSVNSPGAVHFINHTPSSILETPLVPPPSASVAPQPLIQGTLPTIATSIASTISRLGENITLRRAVSLAVEPVLTGVPGGPAVHLASAYLHGGSPAQAGFQTGSLASIVLLRLPPGGRMEKEGLKSFARALARQVVAVPTTGVKASQIEDGAAKASADEDSGAPATTLYEQPLITMPSSDKLPFDQGATVGDVLKVFSEKAGINGELEVVELRRWEVGGEENSM